MRGTQKSGLINYWQNGGRRRFIVSLNNSGEVHVFSTETACLHILGRGQKPPSIHVADIMFPEQLLIKLSGEKKQISSECFGVSA